MSNGWWSMIINYSLTSSMSFDKLLQNYSEQVEMEMFDDFGIDMLAEPPIPTMHINAQVEEMFNQEAPEEREEPSLKVPGSSMDDLPEETPLTGVVVPKMAPKKTPRKSRNNPESDSEEEYTARKTKRINKASHDKVPGYPTKNLLQNMKGPHLDYLQSKLRAKGINPASFPFLKELHKKPGMNLNQYETLYRMEEFREILGKFFEDKVLFRALMISRAVLDTKKTSLRMLRVFEQAFEAKKFTKIN